MFFYSDPPLSPEDIPNGQWLCHTCRMTYKYPTSKSSSTDHIKTEPESRPDTPTANNDTATTPTTTSELSTNVFMPIDHKIRNLRNRSNSRMSISSDTSDKHASKKQILQPEPPALLKALNDPNKKLTPLDELIKAASVLNPKQFELPREMNIYPQFPGNDKSKLFMNDYQFYFKIDCIYFSFS